MPYLTGTSFYKWLHFIKLETVHHPPSQCLCTKRFPSLQGVIHKATFKVFKHIAYAMYLKKGKAQLYILHSIMSVHTICGQ